MPQSGVQTTYETSLVRVIDGDTIVVMYDGKEEKVRLLRIDTPERGEPGFDEVTEALRGLLKGKNIKLEFDGEKRDRYGRLLAYVWVNETYTEADGREMPTPMTMVNVDLVRLGHSAFYTKYGEGKYAEAFRGAEK